MMNSQNTADLLNFFCSVILSAWSTSFFYFHYFFLDRLKLTGKKIKNKSAGVWKHHNTSTRHRPVYHANMLGIKKNVWYEAYAVHSWILFKIQGSLIWDLLKIYRTSVGEGTVLWHIPPAELCHQLIPF